MRHNKIAIVADSINAISETFIKKHMVDLYPGHTIIVVREHLTQSIEEASNHPIISTKAVTDNIPHKLIQYLRRRTGNLNLSTTVFPVAKLLKRLGVTIILGEYLDLTHPWILPAKKYGLRLFAHAHGYDVSLRLAQPHWRRNYCDYNQSDGIITINQISKEKLVDIGVKPEKINIIPCGVDLPDNQTTQDTNFPIRCLAVGRFVPKKAPILLLESFRRALTIFPQLTLDYIGTGELFPSALHFVNAFNLNRTIKLHGALPHERVIQFFSNTSIFIQHSVADPVTKDEEGLPVAILEAMAHGLPVIATRHAGIPDVIINGKNGILVDENDINQMAIEICKLAADITLRIKIGNAARQTIIKNHTWGIEKAKLQSLLNLV